MRASFTLAGDILIREPGLNWMAVKDKGKRGNAQLNTAHEAWGIQL
jgi:hypothetical protein